MKYAQIIGECDPKLIKDTEYVLTSTFIELASSYTHNSGFSNGSQLGGDPFIYQMVASTPHICDARGLEFDNKYKILTIELNANKISQNTYKQEINNLYNRLGKNLLYTAATNGKAYFWAPQFINKLSRIGLRLLVGHEVWHVIYMHPSRRGSRDPLLWNAAIDFKTNFNLMQDLKARGHKDPAAIFAKELGEFITLEEYAAFLKNPFDPPSKLANWNPMVSLINKLSDKPASKEFELINEDKDMLYFAAPNLLKDLKQPEHIYSYLWSQIPVCNTCGKIGAYKKPEEYIKLQKKLKEKYKDEKNKI